MVMDLLKNYETITIIRIDDEHYKVEATGIMERKSDNMLVPVQLTIPKIKPKDITLEKKENVKEGGLGNLAFDILPVSHPSFENCNDILVIIDVIEEE